MAIQEVSFETTLATATAGAPLGSLRADTSRRVQMVAVELFQKTVGVAPNGIGLCRAANAPAGGTTQVAEKRNPVATLTSALGVISGWTTAPTNGTIFKRWIGSAAVGNAYPFNFDMMNPFILPLGGTTGGELVIVNLFNTTPPLFAVNFAFEIE